MRYEGQLGLKSSQRVGDLLINIYIDNKNDTVICFKLRSPRCIIFIEGRFRPLRSFMTFFMTNIWNNF